MQVIYVDVYFAINFLMDLIILIIAEQIFHFGKRMKVRTIVRCALAATFGAIYAVMILVLQISYGWQQMIMTWIVIPGIMAWIALGVRKKEWGRALIIVYCVTFAWHGVVAMLESYSFWGKTVTQANANGSKKLNVLLLIFTAILLNIGIKEGIRSVAMKQKMQRNLYHVRIKKSEDEVQITALCDTGNSLKDPYMGRPVSVLQYKVIEKMLKKDENYILIPFNSVGKEKGMMVGITVDYMEIKNETDCTVIKTPVIGLYKGTFHSKEKYQMLLHPDICRKG